MKVKRMAFRNSASLNAVKRDRFCPTDLRSENQIGGVDCLDADRSVAEIFSMLACGFAGVGLDLESVVCDQFLSHVEKNTSPMMVDCPCARSQSSDQFVDLV
jgi:hypothetical protein